MTDGAPTAPDDRLAALADALAEPADDLGERALLLDRAAHELRSALAELDGV